MLTKMRYPQTTPTAFSGAKSFVENHGIEVWCELCDTVMPDQWFDVKDTAKRLDCIKHYSNPQIYLRAVLKAVIADYCERPDDYEHHPAVQVLGLRMIKAKV